MKNFSDPLVKEFSSELFAAPNVLVVHFDERLRLTYSNRLPNYKKLEDIQGEKWKLGLSKEDTNSITQAFEALKAGQAPNTFLLSLNLGNGEMNVFSCTMFAEDDMQRVKGAYILGVPGSVEETTHVLLEQKNQFIESVASTAPAVIYISDILNQVNTYSNQELYELTGHSTEEFRKLEGGLIDILHHDDIPTVLEHQKTIFHSTEDLVHYVEYRLQHKKGHIVHLASWDRPYRRNSKNEVVQYIGMALDITDLKNAQHELALTLAQSERQKALLERSNEQLEQFAYLASHDLQKPITHVQQFVNLLESKLGEDLDPKSAEYMQHLKSASQSMRKMVDRLLTFSKIENQEAKFDTLNLKAVFDQLMSRSALWSEQEKNAFRVCEDFPTLKGDADLLEILFSNLINNAIKFQHPDRQLQVCVYATPSDGGTVITIKDNGIGIPQGEQEKVLELFHRSKKHGTSGHGIGLSMVKRIAERHNGHVWIESKEGEFTMVNVFFPN